jgi:hypothetical protein
MWIPFVLDVENLDTSNSHVTRKPFVSSGKATNHDVEGCHVIKRPPQVAKYIGSAANGLGFFYIEIPGVVVNPVTTTKIVVWC